MKRKRATLAYDRSSRIVRGDVSYGSTFLERWLEVC